MIARAGGRGMIFRMLLSAAFGYLSLQAIRNIGLFGVVAGFVLAWNLGEWASELASQRCGIPSRAVDGIGPLGSGRRG